MQTDVKERSVLKYLEVEFAEHDVQIVPDPGTGEPVYFVSNGKERYQAAVEPGLLDDRDPATIQQLLTDFNLADVMRQVGDFRVVVTTNGCVFF